MLSRSILRSSSKSMQMARALGSKPVVNSHNEFDPLEEVIVGRVDGATIPEWHVSGKAVWPRKWWDMYKTKGGQPFPKELMDKGTSPLPLLPLPLIMSSQGGAGQLLEDPGGRGGQGAAP